MGLRRDRHPSVLFSSSRRARSPVVGASKKKWWFLVRAAASQNKFVSFTSQVSDNLFLEGLASLGTQECQSIDYR